MIMFFYENEYRLKLLMIYLSEEETGCMQILTTKQLMDGCGRMLPKRESMGLFQKRMLDLQQ